MNQMLVAEGWRDFELVDAGNYMKLERWGQYIIARPEPRAIWNRQHADLWKEAHATFKDENWEFRSQPPTPWEIRFEKLVFSLRPTDFKHTGVFPEQAVNWQWIAKKIQSTGKVASELKVLNLFAYTGGSTMAAALAGAHVTHVDASKSAMMWASENAALSGISKDRIRWIQEDALKFVQRESRRGIIYDAIIMDPPRFGRGAGGELWKLENDLPRLVHESSKLLSPTPLFFLINAYTADLSPLAIEYVLQDALREKGLTTESGEIGIPVSNTSLVLPAGIFARTI